MDYITAHPKPLSTRPRNASIHNSCDWGHLAEVCTPQNRCQMHFSELPTRNGCAILHNMSNLYVALNGWREMLARILKDFQAQENVSPTWLVNPATKRRLKLDLYYPDASLAFRFIGLTAKGQGRQSDWEVMEEEQRDQTRQELCRLNGVNLLLIDPMEETVKQMDHLIRLLSRANRLMVQSDRPVAEKMKWQPLLSTAVQKAEELRTRVARNPDQMMANLAESWRDRGHDAESIPEPEPIPVNAAKKLPPLKVGQRVQHVKFGEGVITSLEGTGIEATIRILFDGDQERTFLVALVADKLSVTS